jgi:hypothetical protein
MGTCACKACGEDLVGEEEAVRVSIGSVDFVDEDGVVDFDDQQEWGYIHLRCFLLAIGDPDGVRLMMQSA